MNLIFFSYLSVLVYNTCKCALTYIGGKNKGCNNILSMQELIFRNKGLKNDKTLIHRKSLLYMLSS